MGLRCGLVLAGVVGLFGVPSLLAQPLVAEPQEPGEIDALLDQIDADLERLSVLPDVPEEPSPFPDGWPDLAPLDGLSPIRTVVHPADRSVQMLTTMLRHTTVQLASTERIVDFVVGDALYFDVRGADNFAYIKAMADNRRTQLSLVTASHRTYSFDVFSTSAVRPDEVLTVLWERETPVLVPSGGSVPLASPTSVPVGPGGLVSGFNDAFELDFVPADRLVTLRREIDRVFQDMGAIEADAARQLARVEELADRRLGEFLDTYPRRVLPRYRLSPEIQLPPLFVHQLWTDGRFTYLRSTAQESPAIYTLSGVDGEEPVLVNVDLTPDGLYVIDHVVGAGFAQLHGARGEWHLWDLPPMSVLPELLEAGLPREGRPPEWIRTRSQRNWVQRHPKLFGTLVGGGIAGFFTVRAIW